MNAALDKVQATDPVIRAIVAELPDTPLSIDTTSPAVAAAALDAGAHLLNDIWGVADDDGMVRLAAERAIPIVLMHNRAEARYRNLVVSIESGVRGSSATRARMTGTTRAASSPCSTSPRPWRLLLDCAESWAGSGM